MDPLSQAVIGAGLAMSFARRDRLRAACVAGALGGMAPDLDILIRSATDPLLALEYHRHFTHSLAMIPVIGAIVGFLLSLFPRKAALRQQLIVSAILGTATHGLLDACTSYGTQLYWPFSNERVAWNNVAIVDPIPTLLGLGGIIWSLRIRVAAPAAVGLSCFIGYLLLGVIQRDRALEVQQQILNDRGHTAQRRSAKPTIFNNIVFRSIYESDGRYYIDAIRVPWFGASALREGVSVAKLDWADAARLLPSTSPQVHDLQRFAWFSDYYLAQMPDGLISDVRYSMIPESAAPMWGIYLRPEEPEGHVTYWMGRNIDAEARTAFFGFLLSGS
jgi:inner membrane protein